MATTAAIDQHGERIGLSSGLRRIIPEPRTRSFIVASSGSGKSTLAAVLLEGYHELHPSHFFYVIDPKSRFVEWEGVETTALFPRGAREENYGRRDGVAVNGRIITKLDQYHRKEEFAFIVQDDALINDLLVHLYHTSDVRRPTIIFLDETWGLINGTRPNQNLRRLIQQGREIGIGIVLINQRPFNIDQGIISEANYLYVGALHRDDDRARIVKELGNDHYRSRLRESLEQFNWVRSDQFHPKRTFEFHLNIL